MVEDDVTSSILLLLFILEGDFKYNVLIDVHNPLLELYSFKSVTGYVPLLLDRVEHMVNYSDSHHASKKRPALSGSRIFSYGVRVILFGLNNMF
jgi:hypothetical protein